eukprot:140416_1
MRTTPYHIPVNQIITSTINEEKGINIDQESPRSTVSVEEPLEAITNTDSTLILLDWDDTLFPTSVICKVLENTDKNGLALICDEQIELLHTLGSITYSLLTELIQKYGANNIHIVTNSLAGWIKNSLFYASCIAMVYKDIENLLIAHEITMDSAQSLYSKKTKNPTSWKRRCFDALLSGNKTKSSYFHIISIGDQMADHDSVKQSIKLLATYKPTHHVIKLKTDPNLTDMVNEMMYIQICFDQIFDVISTPNTPYFENPKSVEPVFIDYYSQEIKSYQNQCMNVEMVHMIHK